MKKINEPSFSEECTLADINRIQKEKRIDNACFTDQKCDSELKLTQFFECTFTKMTFLKKLDKAEFVDVIFDHCDFSNISMQECEFRRVVFQSCRLTGCDMSGSHLQDVQMMRSQAGYLNLNNTHLQSCLWQNCIFAEASMNYMKNSNLEIQSCDFTKTEWANTNLLGLDMSDSIIDGIAVNAENLKGVIVNSEQAIAMARLLGIHVK